MIRAVCLVLGGWLCFGGGVACAGAAQHPLWVIEGEQNTVYLLGSIHVLRASDYPLPDALVRAYEEAEILYMEVDLDDLDEAQAVTFTIGNGTLPPDQTLADVLGPERFEEAQKRAATLGIDLGMLARFEPWVAALTVVQAQLAQLGLEPDQGVEQHFKRLAARDAKEIRGLETLPDQLGILDGLSLQRQGDFLMMSLEESASIASELETLIRAWRTGDSARLASTLTDEFAEFPDLYGSLIVARNRNWTEQIRELLDDEQDYLVVVGALHLVGRDSVIELLRQKRVRARQL